VKLGPSDLVIVVGKIGSGKSTLLHSIMDETIKVKGESKVRGRLAYVEQEPFIISASIKQNVAFGLKFDDEKFKNAFKASHLENDIQNFSNGADTVIGERGINISGGQKARISLARAIYQDADIYLLDDPLSAVDPQVADGIFQDCIMGVLSHKCVILVTH